MSNEEKSILSELFADFKRQSGDDIYTQIKPVPERASQRPREKPTEPNRHIPERVPQRPRENPTEPNRHIAY